MQQNVSYRRTTARSLHPFGLELQTQNPTGAVRVLSCVLVVLSVAIGIPAVTGCSCSKNVTDTRVAQDKPAETVSAVDALNVKTSRFATIGVENDRFVDHLSDELARLATTSTEWKTEHISETTTTQLKQLLQSSIENLPVVAFESNDLVPEANVLYENDLKNGPIRVRRSTKQNSPRSKAGSEQLQEFLNPFARSKVRFEVKTVSVDYDDSRSVATTRVLVSMIAEPTNPHENDTRIQRNAKWICTWHIEEDSSLDLISVESEEFEQGEASNRLRFTDVSADVVPNGILHTQFHTELDFWRQRIDWRLGIDMIGPHGIALGDANGDGLDDVYYCEAGGLPNRLLIHQPDGTVIDRAADAGVDFLEPTQSALFLDLDNDSDQDLVLTSARYVLLLKNNGRGNYSLAEVLQFDSVMRSISAADFDKNGFVDIYACGYFSRTPASGVGLGRPLPYHDANNGTPNHLIANEGNWSFSDVTEQVGLDENNNRFSYAAAWSDFDSDGDSDLYVANDFGRNNLYRNDGGTFRDVASNANAEDISAGMSACWSDFDRDGDFDIYVGNMYSSAGNRIAYQREFQTDADEVSRRQLQRHARGNSLFRNDGNSFTDVSIESGVTMGRWAWSSNFVDLNNDGWDDIFVANGFVTNHNDSTDL